MQNADWLQDWREGRIGFHQNQPQPLLTSHWPLLGLTPEARVLVPLAGKSLDMMWLAEQGHQVLGIELSPLAIDQFFVERSLEPKISHSSSGTHYRAGPYELICGDIFKMAPSVFARCEGVYDRAAMVALTSDARRRYADLVSRHLPRGCQGLMIVLDYNQHEMQGPPFSISHQLLNNIFQRDWHIDVLESRDGLVQEPDFAQMGLSRLTNVAYRLRHR